MSNVLVTNIYNSTEKALSNKNTEKELIKSIQKYFDRNSDIVFDSLLTNRTLFPNSDKDNIYDAAGISATDIKAVIKKTKCIKPEWKIMNEPLNTAAYMIIRYYTLHENKNLLNSFLVYYSFYFYTSLYHKYLPYGANEQIMTYTVNNLSDKYILKQTGSLFKTVEHIVIVCYEKYKDEIIRGNDEDIVNFISALKVRLNNFLKNIKNEYTKNHTAKNYINFDKDSYEEDNFHIADNNSYAVQRIADGAVLKLTTYGADMKMVKLAANMNQVSENEIRNVVLSISHDDINTIRRMCELILQLYLFDAGNKVEEVNSNKFFTHCIELYKKSNTNDKVILEIKSILDMWLKHYSVKYTKTNRAPTLSAFRRAIFIYFVIQIQQS